MFLLILILLLIVSYYKDINRYINFFLFTLFILGINIQFKNNVFPLISTGHQISAAL